MTKSKPRPVEKKIILSFPPSLAEELQSWMTKQPGDLRRAQAIRWIVKQYLEGVKK